MKVTFEPETRGEMSLLVKARELHFVLYDIGEMLRGLSKNGGPGVDDSTVDLIRGNVHDTLQEYSVSFDDFEDTQPLSRAK